MKEWERNWNKEKEGKTEKDEAMKTGVQRKYFDGEAGEEKPIAYRRWGELGRSADSRDGFKGLKKINSDPTTLHPKPATASKEQKVVCETEPNCDLNVIFPPSQNTSDSMCTATPHVYTWPRLIPVPGAEDGVRSGVFTEEEGSDYPYSTFRPRART